MKIAIDLDEVLGEVVGELLKWHNETKETRWTLGEVTKYRFSDCFDITRDEEKETVLEFWASGRLKNLPVVAGAREAVAELARNHQLFVVTARVEKLRDVTQNWLDRYFPNMFQKVVFANQYMSDEVGLAKGDICQELGCEVLIDDNTTNIESGWNKSLKLIIFNRPWNIYHRLPPSVMRVNNWNEIVQAINKIAKQYV